MRFLVSPGKRVLELGFGRGELLVALKSRPGVGADCRLRVEKHFSLGAVCFRKTRHAATIFVVDHGFGLYDRRVVLLQAFPEA